MRILVTGGNGFIGKHILSQLIDEGHEVVAISSKNKIDSSLPNISWLSANLIDFESCSRAVLEARADVLIHMAWYTEHGKFWNAPQNFEWCHATFNLLKAFVGQGGNRAIFAGTCAEYDARFGFCIEDETPCYPTSVYGDCKDATRRLTKSFADLMGIEWVWARIFSPFGFGEPQNRLLPSVINSLLSGNEVQCSHGKQIRDFLPVEEVAGAFVHLACGTSVTGIVNVASGTPVAISELVKFCVAQINPAIAPKFGAIKAMDSEPPFLVGSNQRLKNSGWSQRMDWQEALPIMIDQYKQHFKNRRSSNGSSRKL